MAQAPTPQAFTYGVGYFGSGKIEQGQSLMTAGNLRLTVNVDNDDAVYLMVQQLELLHLFQQRSQTYFM